MARIRNHRHVAPDWLLVTGLLTLPVGVASVGAQEFDLDRGAENLVRFLSRTNVQEFEGTTSRIDGYVALGSTPLGSASVKESELYFEVDLASLDTGIGLRNRHMRDDYLEVAKHPFAKYEGRIVQVDSTQDGSLEVTAEGTFSLHGVVRSMRVPCAVTTAGSGYRARCSFSVLLSDFKIAIPRIMFLKLANEIELQLDFTVAPAKMEDGGGP